MTGADSPLAGSANPQGHSLWNKGNIGLAGGAAGSQTRALLPLTSSSPQSKRGDPLLQSWAPNKLPSEDYVAGKTGC